MNDGSFFFVTVGDDLSVYIAYIEVLFIPETCRFIFFGACTKSKLFGGDIVESIVFRFNVFAVLYARSISFIRTLADAPSAMI